MIAENQYGTADIQNELLDLMKIFHAFCVENKIKYSLFGGSGLGAVRHDGFIPWDDDLDICVDRKNYRKLLAGFGSCEGLSMHQNLWVKRVQKAGAKAVRGYVPTLDIFVIDNVPDSKILFRVKVLLLSVLQGMLKKKRDYSRFALHYRVLLYVTYLLGRIFPTALVRRWYDRASRIGNGRRTRYAHCSNDNYHAIRIRYKSDTFKNLVLHKFEDAEFYIPQDYDDYLTARYGDYMKLPAESQRKPQHAKVSVNQ